MRARVAAFVVLDLSSPWTALVVASAAFSSLYPLDCPPSGTWLTQPAKE